MTQPSPSDKRFTRSDFNLSVDWWVRRAIYYNGIMFASAMLFIALVSVLFYKDLSTGFNDLLFNLPTVIAYAVIANAAFTGCGLLLIFTVWRFPEINPRREEYFRIYYRLGLAFSVAVNLVGITWNIAVHIMLEPS